MAKQINYGPEIKNGSTIRSVHVSQFVDALTAADDYDINISGSLGVVGTISGSFIGDGSGLTGLPTGSDGSQLTTKAGFVSSASFQDTGSESSADVTFATPFSSSDYSVALTYRDLNLLFLGGDEVYVNNKTSNGFTVTSTLNSGFWGQLPDSGVDYIAVANTETSVFTIPTSSFGLNSKIGNVPSESFGPTNPGPPINDYSASVTFATPFSSSDYAVSLTAVSDLGSGDAIGQLQVFNKTTTGFKIQYDGLPDWGSVDFIAAANGETAVTSSFTLNAATASFFAEGIVTASATGNTMTFTKDDGSTFDVDINSSELTTKAGSIPSSSFQDTQSISYATVTFATPFSSSDYSVAVNWVNPDAFDYRPHAFEIKNKTTSSFQLWSQYSNAVVWAPNPGSSVDFIAIANTETTVFTIPTSSFGLNSKIGIIPSESFQNTGSISYANVTFATPFSSSDYGVACSLNSTERSSLPAFDIAIGDKTPSGFTAIFTDDISRFAVYNITSVNYIAAANGETAVTSSFTLTSATASFFAEGIVTASATGNTMTFTKDDGSTFDVDINSSELTTKAGFIPSSSFQATGSNDSIATVTFATPFSSSDYSVALSAENFGKNFYVNFDNFSIENKTTSSFDVQSDIIVSGWNNVGPGSGVNYIAVANTETSVFTIPTSSFGLNSKIGTIPTSSYTTSGSYSVATVTFATPFSSSDYGVSHLGNNLGSYSFGGYNFLGFAVTDKTPSGFTSVFLNSTGNLNNMGVSSIDYIAAANGETAVTSSFTLTSATASYVEQSQTASISLNDLTRQSIQVTNGTASVSRELLIPDNIEVVEDYVLSANQGGNLQPCTIINFPSTLRRVEDNGLSFHKIINLNLPPSLNYVGTSSFSGTPAQSISSSGLTEIGPSAFLRIASTVDLPNTPPLESLILNEGLITIGEDSFAFASPNSVTEATAAKNKLYTTTTKGYYYAIWTGSIDLTIPSTVNYIGELAFAGHKIKNLTFSNPSSSLFIDTASFYASDFDTSSFVDWNTYTSSLELLDSISIGDNTTMGSQAFSGNTIVTASIGDNCTFHDRVFYKPKNNTFISQLTLPDSTTFSYVSSSNWSTTIDWGVGALNKSLITELTFSGSGWTEVPKYLFNNINFLNNVESVERDTFYSTLGSFPTFTDSNLNKISTASFAFTNFLTESIVIPDNVKTERYSFFSSLLNNPASSSDLNTVEIGDNCTIYLQSFNNSSISTLIIGNSASINPGGTTSSPFKNVSTTNPRYARTANYLRSLSFGNHCNIGENAFNGAGNITLITGSVTIPPTTILNTSSFLSFANGTNLENTGFNELIFSGSGITSIPKDAFKTSGINTLTFNGSNLETINTSSFQANNITGSITFPSTLTDIGPLAFSSNQIETASIPTACTTASDSFDGSVRVERF